MLELTEETAAKAAGRARQHHGRVSRITDSEIAVSCANAGHPGGHVTRFERRADNSLWGECFVRETGEACPSAIGRRVCWHLLAGVALFIALERRRAAADPDAAVEHAVEYDGPMPVGSTEGAPPARGEADDWRALPRREKNERMERILGRGRGFGGNLCLS